MLSNITTTKQLVAIIETETVALVPETFGRYVYNKGKYFNLCIEFGK
jgi:hypothetical protein